MAPPAGTLRVGRYFLALLALFIVLFGIVFWPGARHTPKLGLDLEGGTQVTFKARLPSGKTPSKSSMLEARDIMEQRVNGYGVSNADVVIQGTNQIVISVPGKSASDLASIGQAAVLNFRPVIMPPVTVEAVQVAEASATAGASSSASGTATSTAGATAGAATSSSPAPTSPSGTATSGASAQAFGARALAASSTSGAAGSSAPATSSNSSTATSSSSSTASASGSAGSSGSAAPTPTTTASTETNYCVKPAVAATGTLPTCENPLASLGFAVPTSDEAFSTLTSVQQAALQAAVSQFKCSSKPADDKQAITLLACDSSQDNTATTAFLLGSIIVPGSEISSAGAVAPGSTAGQTGWDVNVGLKTTGAKNWAKWTSAHNIGSTVTSTADITTCNSAGATPCSDFVAFTLDGAVLETPVTEGAITTPTTTISGSFSQSQANQLAQQLNYGALPLSFDLLTKTTVSASLGSGQLKDGLLAGGIGLILVVVYSLIYYRALGLVTIASLLVSGGLTYASLVILGHEIGFTLTLAGIAGFIVAVGITADSFVVFFERIKDEVHEGRSMRVAVPRAWIRARRTILSADTVSFLAAATLYYFAAGDVRGFAFTLGLSTILDLVVVFLFTHPMLSMLSRSRSFGSARFSGLDAAREGGVAIAEESGSWRPRRARSARSAGTGSGARSQPERAGSSVAVLDNPGDDGLGDLDDAGDVRDVGDVGQAGGDPTTPSPAASGPSATVVGEPATGAEGATGDPSAPAGQGTAQPTTAAQRAAARRARMRAKPDGSRS